jgi:hypothetical protein
MPHSTIFQDEKIFFYVNPECSIPQLKELRNEALHDSHDWYIERSANMILALTPLDSVTPLEELFTA